MSSKLTKIYANFETQLATKLAVGAVTGTLSSVLTKDSITIASGKYTMTFNLGESNEEHLKFDLDNSTKAMTNIVSVKRDGSEVSGVQKEHRVGAVGKITDFVNVKAITDILNGDDTLDGSKPIKYDAEPTVSDRKQVPHAGYVQDILSGAVGTANDQASGTTKVTKNQGTKAKAQSVYVREQSTPDKTLLTESFKLAFIDKLISYAGGNTPNFIDPGFGGDLAINTQPSNTETFVLTVDGTAITFTAVSSIGAAPGNFLIGADKNATRANLAALINNPTVTNANQVALTGAQLTACQKVNCTDDLSLNIFVRATNPAVATFSAVENFAGGGNTWTANTTKNRYDLVVVDNAGTLQIRKGTEAVSPAVPTPTTGDIVLCAVLNRCAMTTVRDYNVAGQGYITDWYDLAVYRTDIATTSALAAVAKFGGDGSDGALAITSGATNIDLGGAQYVVKQYTSISITGTGQLTFSNPHANGTIIVLKSQGNVTLTSSTIPNIDASGMGAAGGAGGASANASGSAGNTGIGIFDDASHAGNPGTTAGTQSTGGAIFLSNTIHFYTRAAWQLSRSLKGFACGSGGGGGSASNCNNWRVGGAGGNGGGGLLIQCGGALNFTSTLGISVAGKNGSNGITDSGGVNNGRGGSGGGGGGAGGFCIVLYNTLTSASGTINCAGGTGGNGGDATSDGTGGGGGQQVGGGGGAGAGADGGAGGNGAASVSSQSNGNVGTAAGGRRAGGGGGGGASRTYNSAGTTTGGAGQAGGASENVLVAKNNENA